MAFGGLASSVKSAFTKLLTPFTGKRKREEAAPLDLLESDQAEEPPSKRPVAPTHPQKALQFGQERQQQQQQRQPPAVTFPAAARAAELRQQQLQAGGPVSLRGPASEQQPQRHPGPVSRLGEALVRQAAQPTTAYNARQPRCKFPSLTRLHGTPTAATPSPALTKGSLRRQAFYSSGTPGVRWPRVQQGSFRQQLGQATLFGQALPALQQTQPKLTQQPASSGAAARRRFASPHGHTILAARRMGEVLSKFGVKGFGGAHVDIEGEVLLRRGVKVLEELEPLEQEHKKHAAPAQVVVDLTEEEQAQQQQQQQSRHPVLAPGSMPVLEAAAVSPLPLTPGGGLPFSPSLLRTEPRLQYESLLQRVEAAAVGPVMLDAKARHTRDEDYQKIADDAAAAMQRAEEVNRSLRKVVKTIHTTLDEELRREAELKRELKQIEERLLHKEQRRKAAQVPEAAKLPAAEEEVVVLSSDEEDEEEHEAEESESAVEGESEDEAEHLAELHVSEALPQLEDKHYEVYGDVLRKDGNPAQRLVLHERSQIEIRRKDIACMAPLQWLNDEVINLYMALLLERDMRLRGKGKVPKCHFFSTFFANKLYKDTGYKYKDVARWTVQRRLSQQGQLCGSVLDCDRIILPVHQGMHWVCAMIDIPKKQLVYYDSLLGEDRKCLDHLAQYIADEYQHKRQQTVDTSSWERVFPKSIPRQHNGCDCGVFALLFADYAGRNAPMDFSQSDIDYFRVKIVNDLLNQRVD